MPYKNDEDRFANRRLKRPVQRIQAWAEKGFNLDLKTETVRCLHCGKVTRYNAPSRNRHFEDCVA